jgi:hypothetical protein
MGLPRLWPREPFTSALETLIASPARATVVRDAPDLLTAGTDPRGACACIYIICVCMCVRERGGERERDLFVCDAGGTCTCVLYIG